MTDLSLIPSGEIKNTMARIWRRDGVKSFCERSSTEESGERRGGKTFSQCLDLIFIFGHQGHLCSGSLRAGPCLGCVPIYRVSVTWYRTNKMLNE